MSQVNNAQNGQNATAGDRPIINLVSGAKSGSGFKPIYRGGRGTVTVNNFITVRNVVAAEPTEPENSQPEPLPTRYKVPWFTQLMALVGIIFTLLLAGTAGFIFVGDYLECGEVRAPEIAIRHVFRQMVLPRLLEYLGEPSAESIGEPAEPVAQPTRHHPVVEALAELVGIKEITPVSANEKPVEAVATPDIAPAVVSPEVTPVPTLPAPEPAPVAPAPTLEATATPSEPVETGNTDSYEDERQRLIEKIEEAFGVRIE